MLELLGGARDLILVILGFGLVIVVHELGHFLAARWAGIRVHEFAIGFGPAICSWRQGMGFRRGSTTPEYVDRLKSSGATGPSPQLPGVSPTEYRLNWVPLGGYVRMLGQEDLNPSATSGAPDSYATQPVWKRLIVISAGVVMNVILAAALFIVVFMVGLKAPPARIGFVAPGAAAATAVAVNADDAGVTQPGLQPGDTIVEINGDPIPSFQHIAAKAGLARPGNPLSILVSRPGIEPKLLFRIAPRESEETRLLELGVAPPISTTLARPLRADEARWRDVLEQAGLAALRPGMRLASIDGRDVRDFHEVEAAVESSSGAPLPAVFTTPGSAAPDSRVTLEIHPRPALQRTDQMIADTTGGELRVSITHLLGLAPAMSVVSVEKAARDAGLRPGDVFARIGAIEWPNYAQGIEEIRRHSSREISLLVLRDGRFTPLTASVRGGRIGFTPGETEADSAIVTRPPSPARAPAPTTKPAPAPDAAAPAAPAAPPAPLAATRLSPVPGSIILTVEGRPVRSLADVREALRDATRSAHDRSEGADVHLTLRLPIGEGFGAGPVEERTWSLTPDDVQALHALAWVFPLNPFFFEPALTTLEASSPAQAIAMGHAETKRVIVMTYITLLRLFEGSVRVEHLKGPVGIAHIGTQFAERGVIDLLFFLAIISANIAVLNFLPLPIVDGGHVVFLIIEGITGKPVSIAVQNAATILGLILLGSLFLVVTFNDLVALLGG